MRKLRQAVVNTFGSAEAIEDPVERNRLLDSFAHDCTNDQFELLLTGLYRHQEEALVHYIGRILLDSKQINCEAAMQKLSELESGQKAVLDYMAELSAERSSVKSP